jgi:hypothetical protein
METNGVVEIDKSVSTSKAWEMVTDAVNYPVDIAHGYWKDDAGDYVRAGGETNTGRDKQFNFVVVDKFRNGERHAIACVTEGYGTLSTAETYNDLRTQLEMSEQNHIVKKLYVSGTGGAQALTIELKDMVGLTGVPDEIAMEIRLDTSVDGTKNHALTLLAHNRTGDVSYSLYGGEYRLRARHTKTIGERTIEFIPTVNLMIKNWNDVIMPMMILMFDSKFDRNASLDLLQSMAEEANVSDVHIAAMTQLYSSDRVRTNDNTDSLYRVNATIHQYITDELSEKPELQERFRLGIAKAMAKQIAKLKK